MKCENGSVDFDDDYVAAYLKDAGVDIWNGAAVLGDVVSLETGEGFTEGMGAWKLVVSSVRHVVPFLEFTPCTCGMTCKCRLGTYDIRDHLLCGNIASIAKHMGAPSGKGVMVDIILRLMYPRCIREPDYCGIMGIRVGSQLMDGSTGWRRREQRYRGEECLGNGIKLDCDTFIRRLYRMDDAGKLVSVSVLHMDGNGREDLSLVSYERDGHVLEFILSGGQPGYARLMDSFDDLYGSDDTASDLPVAINSGGRRTVSVSMHPEMLGWLREHVGGGTISGYLCKLVRERMEADASVPLKGDRERCPEEMVCKFIGLLRHHGAHGVSVHSWHIGDGHVGCEIDAMCDPECNHVGPDLPCPVRISVDVPLDGDVWRVRYKWRCDGDAGFLSVSRTYSREYAFDMGDPGMKDLYELLMAGRSWIPRKKGN